MLNKHGKQITGLVLAVMSANAYADPECAPLDQANLGYVQPGEEGLPVATTTPVETTGICQEPAPTNNVVDFVPAAPAPVVVQAPTPAPVVVAPAPAQPQVVVVPVAAPTPSHVTIVSTRIEIEGAEYDSAEVDYDDASDVVYEETVQVETETVIESSRVEYEQTDYQYEAAEETVVVEEAVEVEVEVVEEPLVTTVYRPAPKPAPRPVVKSAPKKTYSSNITIRNYGCAKTYLTAEYVRQPGSHGGCGNRELYAPTVKVEDHAGYGAQPVVEETIIEETIVEEAVVETPVSTSNQCVDFWMGLCRRMTSPGNHGSGL